MTEKKEYMGNMKKIFQRGICEINTLKIESKKATNSDCTGLAQLKGLCWKRNREENKKNTLNK